MKSLKTISGILMLILILSIAGCQKDPVQGPKGDTGATGAQGTQGNANVHWTTFTVNPSDWVYDGTLHSSLVTLSVSGITTDIINSGAVLVYMLTSSGVYAQLPATIYPQNWYSESFDVYTAVGTLQIRVSDSDLSQPGTFSSPITFKAIVISSALLNSNPNLDLNSYAKVKTVLNLED